jgi:protein-disulfide isomerase/uncharacterized membrane protein
MTKKTTWYLSAGAAVVGLIVAVYLARHFYELQGGENAFKALCNSRGMSCDTVATSPYAQFGFGIPVASVAAGWFGVQIALLLFSLEPAWKASALRFAFLLSAAGSVVSLVFLGIMFGKIGTACTFCLVIDLCIWALTAALWAMIRSDGKSLASGLQMAKRSGHASTLIAVAGGIQLFVPVLLHAFLNSVDMGGVTPQEIVSSIKLGAPQSVSLPTDWRSDDAPPAFGPENARVTIVEFSDFQCPHCQKGAKILHALQYRFPNDVRVVLRNYPLDGRCNPKSQGGAHAYACETARAIVCAYRAERASPKFELLYERVFERQHELSAGKAIEWAAELGLDAARLKACAEEDGWAKARVSADIAEGDRLGVQSTPTFFVNGYKVEGAYPLPIWVALVESLLK